MDSRQRPDIPGDRRKYERRTSLVGSLDQTNGKLGPQRHHRSAPGLTARGIPEVIRLKIISEVINKALGSLIIYIQVPRSDQTEQRSDSPTQAPDP